MKIRLNLNHCLLVCIVFATLMAQTGLTNGPAVRLGTFIAEERTTYFGVQGDKQEEITQRQDWALCRVSRQGQTITSEDSIIVKVTKPSDSGRVTVSESTQVLTAENTYGLDVGQSPLFGKVAFNPELPKVGFEWFYFPMLSLDVDFTKETEHLLILETPPQFEPKFKGAWMCRNKQTDGRIQIAGPYFLESTDRKFLISGSLDHEIGLEPMRIYRMAGDAIVRIRPAKAYSFDSPQLADVELLRFEQLIGQYRFQVVPIDSPGAKLINLPKQLSALQQKDN